MTLLQRLDAGQADESVATAASNESMDSKDLAALILEGRAAIPRNAAGRARPVAIGEGLRTKVNANIGTSPDFPSIEEEVAKAGAAVESGSDALMDLSTGGDLRAIRNRILNEVSIPVGTVPVYQAMVEAIGDGNSVAVSEQRLIEVVEEQASAGVDFMTIHAGLTSKALEFVTSGSRLAGIVSRGGAFLAAWMIYHQKENPFFEQFDQVLEICGEHDVTLSLGDGLRPGCIADSTDAGQVAELLELGGLLQRCRQAGVQAIVEGPGHVPLNEIVANVKLQKKLCRGAPFYVLGPIVTDVAPGYDHITGAIGGSLAASAGADFLCYVTPREHLGLPTVEDVRAGVIASRIAAHAGDLAKGVPGAAEWDERMAAARKALDWPAQVELSMDPRRASKAYSERRGDVAAGCTMCSDFCAMNLVSEYLDSPDLSCL